MNWLFDRILVGLAFIAGATLPLLMLMIVADVTMRALELGSLDWVLEASEYVLLGVLCLGMPWLAREKGHIAVDVLTQSLADRVKLPLERVVVCTCALLLAWLCYWAIRSAVADYSGGIMTYGIYPLPRFILPSLLAFALGLSALEYLRQLLRPPTDKATKEKALQ